MSRYIEGKGKLSNFAVDLPDNVVKCVACYHHCLLEDGHRGICGIRHNMKGKLYSFVNTRPCSTHYDPIEKKPLYHFYPGSTIYSIGTVGCNMRCSFCQNWQISQTPKGSHLEIEDVAKKLYCRKTLSSELAVKETIAKGCNSIAYTYNEPTIFADFIFDTAKLAHEKGIKNVLVTNGYQSVEVINRLAPYIDAVNVDLKTFKNSFYSRLCGTRIHPILRNIRIWYEIGVHVELTTLLIPDENDSDEEITQIAQFIKDIDPDIVWHISAYRDAFRMHGKGRTPVSSLQKAYKIGKKMGLNYIYMGNVSSEKHATTFCKKCSTKLVTRGHWGRGGRFTKKFKGNGKCGKCNTLIPGEWSVGEDGKGIVNHYTQRKNADGRVNSVPNDLIQLRVIPEGELLRDQERIVILYATQTGVSEEYAKELKRAGDIILSKIEKKKNKKKKKKEKKKPINIIVRDMEYYNVEEELRNEKYVIVVTSTFFYGRIPRNGERFLKYLDRGNLVEASGEEEEEEEEEEEDHPLLLEGLNFGVMGIGSTGTKPIHLETYQVIARHICKRFEKLGATMMVKAGEANKKKDFKLTLDQWKNELWNSFAEKFM